MNDTISSDIAENHRGAGNANVGSRSKVRTLSRAALAGQGYIGRELRGRRYTPATKGCPQAHSPLVTTARRRAPAVLPRDAGHRRADTYLSGAVLDYGEVDGQLYIARRYTG